MKKQEKTYTLLDNAVLPTKQQKERMLNQVLYECRKYDASPIAKVYRLITTYPWRFAFGFSMVQAVTCTMIWGIGYTNTVLRIFGG